jgi:DNA-directed RNA polymerase subunit RPC12/RpoP
MGEHEQYVCEACGESFESSEELRRHVYAVGQVK